MIAFNFDYYLPSSINEAVNLFQELDRENGKPVYYGGGTEIITFARKNDLHMGAVIDLKGIPEAKALYEEEDKIVIGAAVTLTAAEEASFFPLLTKTSGFAADHTSRDKITFCGNICGRIIYKEAILTPLITNAHVLIAGKYGVRTEDINKIFDQKLKLEKGELLLQIILDRSCGELPYYAVKKTKLSRVAYPLLSMAAVKKGNKMRYAFSGVCSFPFRSNSMEECLSNTSLDPEKRVEKALKYIPGSILSNAEGSSEYRKFVLKNTLLDSIKVLEG